MKNLTLWLLLFRVALFGQVPVINPILGSSSVCSSPSLPSSYSTSASNSPTSYSWSVMPSTGVIISNITSSVTPINFPYSSGTYTINCVATNSIGTSAQSQFTVLVLETPTVTFSGANSFCQGSSTNLQASSTILMASPTISYNWDPNIGLSTTSGTTVIANPSASIIYTVTAIKGSCSSSSSLAVTVTSCVAGISEFNNKNKSLPIFPNPTNGYFIIKPTTSEKVIILNDIGQIIKTGYLESGIEYKIDGLNAGVYYIYTPTSKTKLIVIN